MPRAPRTCGTKGCYEKVPCAKHRRAPDRRPSPSQRGYDAQHVSDRAAWVPVVALGNVECRRASNGTGLNDDGPVIEPGTPWHLGHPDLACPAPKAPEHVHCNVATNLPGRRRGPAVD